MFTGGSFSQASIFALGIMPYISASIVIQLLGMAYSILSESYREKEKVVEEKLTISQDI